MVQKRCFVVCEFGTKGSDKRRRSDSLLKDIIRPILEEEGYDADRSVDDSRPGEITSQIMKDLHEADLVIADLTGSNPNVLYEVALRHATGKPFIHLCQDPDGIPFDIGTLNAIALPEEWNVNETQTELRKQVQAIRNGRVDFSNPASRYHKSESPIGLFSAKLYTWELQYEKNLSGKWLTLQRPELQQTVRLWDLNEIEVPEKQWLRKGLAEYLTYKLMQGHLHEADMCYIVENRSRNIVSGSWANFSPPYGQPMAIPINGFHYDEKVIIMFDQPSEKFTSGSLMEEVGPFAYTVDFEFDRPGSPIMRGTLYHPEPVAGGQMSGEKELIVARTRLIPKAGVAG